MQLSIWQLCICACLMQTKIAKGAFRNAELSNGRAALPTTPQVVVANGSVDFDSTVTSFSGGQYEYDRKDGESFIDLISSSRQQVTMLLKSGQMKGLGVQYHDHRIIVGFVGDALTVSLNGRELAMRLGESKQEHVLEADGYKSLSVVWSSHKNALGDAVEVTTDLLRLLVWVNPAQAQDGQIQDGASLSLEVALLGTPEPRSDGLEEDTLGGAIGEGFWELVAAGGAPEDIDGVPSPRHEMASYFECRRPLATASGGGGGGSGSRLLMSRAGARGQGVAALAFPLRSRAGGVAARSNMRRLARQARAAREVQELPRSFRDLRKSRPVSRSLGTS